EDNDISGRAKDAFDHHFAHSCVGGCHIQCYDSALTRGVAIGFNHDGSAMLLQVAESIGGAGKSAMLSGGNRGLAHQLFGKGFTAFQGRAACSRPKDGDAVLAKYVSYALDQGNLRPDYRQVNLLALGE